jgi:lysophospholipase L1-like esterase
MKGRSLTLLVRVLFIVIFMIVQPGSLASASQAKSVCADDIKVMPLGDSITSGKYSGHDTSDTSQGALDDIGYRKDLWDLLATGGFSVDFVGTQSNGSTYPFSDPEHEGHNGWTDEQIADNIYNDGGENWLSQNPADVITLHIGTNSIGSDPSDVERILDEIDEYEADTSKRVIVILARIIDMVPNNPVVNQFNNNVETMVTGRSEYGVDLFMVDMEDGAGINYSIFPGDPAGDMIDGLHPYATGYTKMAAEWMTAFEGICKHVYLPFVYKIYDSNKYLWE